ncbi:hypothetical protein A5E_A1040 [Vibrio cholerae B33]|nr:hypothetical protein A5E_A1040 [Vibrio cholerae B33]
MFCLAKRQFTIFDSVLEAFGLLSAQNCDGEMEWCGENAQQFYWVWCP